MDSLGDKAWVAVAAITALGTLGLLHCVACALRNHKHVHDLRVRVGTLRNEQVRRLTEGSLGGAKPSGGEASHGSNAGHAKAA